ncbi:PREDICTED: butyrophilin-like protein 10 [Propithecus coquereli]|uniref:butyrophilin-like protein 10 n=1 Tax=Propithecus coquereli TaxID=379532 RepID=UPI00063F685D|nr:PREDICTED: butyrophilin-like protein 10 [Propithecus coquereli]
MAKTRGGDAFVPACLLALVLLRLLPAGFCKVGNADFEVLGPDGPVQATVGGVAELPCHLSPPISAQDMELRWYRDRPSPAVHLRAQGKDDPRDQLASYSGRTAFVSDRVAEGKAAVRIRNVTAFDDGTYRCRFRDGAVHSEAALQLRVAGLGSEPRVQVTEEQDRGVRVACASEGWYPQPRVEWTGSRGQAVPSVTNLSASATTGLWAVASSVTIEDRTLESISCSISIPLHPERKVAKSHLPGECFVQFCLQSLGTRLQDSSCGAHSERGGRQVPVLSLAGASREVHLCAGSRGGAETGSGFMEWKVYVPLIVAAVGLVTSVVICLWGRREKNRKQLEEEREPREEEQRRQASGDGLQPLPGRRESGFLHVSPSLDPDTASAKLSLSEDRKSVTRLFFAQDLPPSPGRFDPDPCVLAQERFVSGRYYWEVEVGDRSAWTLGVCLEDIGRKGRVPKSPQQGLWALELHKKRFRALSYPRTRLRPSKPLRRVGIFLDCDAREISFYSVTDGSQVYRFSGLPFLAPLKPFLCLWTHDPHPVTFCPVVQETQEETGPPGGPKSHP